MSPHRSGLRPPTQRTRSRAARARVLVVGAGRFTVRVVKLTSLLPPTLVLAAAAGIAAAFPTPPPLAPVTVVTVTVPTASALNEGSSEPLPQALIQPDRTFEVLRTWTATPPSPPPPPVPQVADPEAVGAAALARIGYPYEDLGWTVAFHGARDGYLGMAYPSRKHIDIWVRSYHTVADVTHTLAHELGHAVDVNYNDGQRRARWLELRGLPADQAWWSCSACSDYDVGAGDFAEVFAYWETGAGPFNSKIAPLPDADELAQLEELFWP